MQVILTINGIVKPLCDFVSGSSGIRYLDPGHVLIYC